MLRVAYLFERFPSFGQTFCYREVAELVRQGADVTVFSIRHPENEPPQNWDAEIVRRVVYLPGETDLIAEAKRVRLSADAAQTLREWDRQSDFLRLHQAVWIGQRLRAAGIERVHAHFAGMAARTAYWIQEFFGIEYSLTAHANDIFAPRDFVVSLEKLFERARAVVTVSDFAVEQLRKKFPDHAAKFHRVYNGVEPEKFSIAGPRSAPPLILSIGRLIEKKGFGDLIRACEILRRNGARFRCEIIGEGPLRENLQAQIAEAKLEDAVELIGPKTQSEISQRMSFATVFALPCCLTSEGDMDNLPTVIMEAMAAGLPVVSTTLAGIPEMVQAGITGELVPPNEPEKFARALEIFLNDPACALEFGERGRELAAKKFSIQTNVSALARILSAPR